MKILVIGTGMYTTGRNTDGYGTIFPSIIEFQRINRISNLEVIFIGQHVSNSLQSKRKILKALKISGLKFKVTIGSQLKCLEFHSYPDLVGLWNSLIATVDFIKDT